MLQKLRTNLAIRSKWGEVNGAMGDLGTYDLNLSTTIIFTGVHNMVTGAIYSVPMPVQPMKAITAVMTAGICTSTILVVLGVTRLMQPVYRLLPLSVVRGIRLSQEPSSAMSKHWLGLDGLVLAIVCACFIVIINGAGEERRSNPESGNNIKDESSMRKRKWKRIMTALPSAFIIFLLGVVLAFIREPKVVRGIKFGPSSIEVVKISRHAWKEGFIEGTIPQLPLSILNSERWLCGDLGASKLILGLVLGSSIVKVLDQFPVGVLSVLLLFAGIELALAARDMDSKEEAFVMLICAAVSLVGLSATLEFLRGIVVHVLLRLRNLSSIRSSSATP
ncbi:hypothetical protein EUGRSUZ_A01699 [Eucalyptus grandis]|uniref:Uncharacterized protein n=2 Tax=Eucalyptus grandis TaxID=71139 RepID=A0A059DG25_EUCGR|nr:hypothetical protein EUGRSUZ_A01699 [Eucalyptus grandis]